MALSIDPASSFADHVLRQLKDGVPLGDLHAEVKGFLGVALCAPQLYEHLLRSTPWDEDIPEPLSTVLDWLSGYCASHVSLAVYSPPGPL